MKTDAVRLSESLREDQRTRWRRGDAVRVETYLERCPELRDAPEAVLDLIYNEMVLRQEAGHTPELEEYLRRFPPFAEQLPLLFEVHCALEEGAATERASGEALPLSAPAGPPRAPAPLPSVPGYRIEGELGHGGMGVVYQARQESLGRVVALKMLLGGGRAHQRALARFQAEARLVAQVQHPNIVQVFEVGEHDGQPFFAMEYVAGMSLAARIAGAPQPARDAARLVAVLARAMHFAHQRGIVHRDLKPANVLLAEDGTPKISDFGLAKQLDDDSGRTRTGDVLGTPSYMAPEQAAGKVKELGPLTDVYALGAVLYELLTGRPPFRAETATETLLQVLHDEPVPPSRLRPGCPRDLETVCLKCLRKEPGRRYASAEALAEDLERFLDGKPVVARRVTAAERAFKWARRRPAAAALIGLVGALLLGSAAGLWWHGAAERRRQAGLRAEARQALDGGRTAFVLGDWSAAQSHLEAVVARAEAEPSLADLRPDAEGLLAQARDRRYEAETYRQFVRLGDDALFHGMNALSRGTLLTGMDAAAHGRAAEGAARQALALVGLAPDGDAGWSPDPRFQGAARRAEITGRCYTLLLVLADVVARRAAPEGGASARESLRLLDRASRVSPPTRAYHLRRARLLEGLGDSGGARSEAAAAEAAAPAGALDHFLTGDTYYRRGERARAMAHFRAAVALEPGHFWAQCYLAVCHLDAGQWDQAASALTVCLLERPDFVWAHLLRGFAHREPGALDAAEADFAQAGALLDQSPNDPARYVLLVNRGALRLRQERLEEAAEDFRRAAAVEPEGFAPYLNLAKVYERQGKTGEAAREFGRALRRRPPAAVVAEFHAQRAFELYKARQFEAAAEECAASLRQRDNAFAHGTLGHVRLAQGRYPEAARAFDQYAAAGGKPDTDVYRGRGLARLRQGDYLGARDDYTRAMEIKPDAPLYAHRGWAYFFADAWQPALRDFDEAIRRAPALAEAYAGRGLCRALLGRYREAAADAAEALQRGPRGPEMVHNVACAFALAAGKAETDPAARDLAARYRAEAVTALRKALEMLPPAERGAFWRTKMYPDTALDPVRRSPEFQRLVTEYGPPNNSP